MNLLLLIIAFNIERKSKIIQIISSNSFNNDYTEMFIINIFSKICLCSFHWHKEENCVKSTSKNIQWNNFLIFVNPLISLGLAKTLTFQTASNEGWSPKLSWAIESRNIIPDKYPCHPLGLLHRS